MANTKAFKVKNGLDLGAYSKAISDTAVDVFVYDTSQDSDGGAWRHRTQATSWYNETLNTATRGSRKEFPAVAVIVAESSQVTIYDGDDPDLPMWMVFNRGTGTWPSITAVLMASSGNTATASCVAMSNATLFVGSNYSATDNPYSTRVNFIDEQFVNSGSAKYLFSNTIAQRNSTLSGIIQGNQEFVDKHINDVAMTVLPNAPIDAATGLPVPTIAVATDGGHSFILDNGNVVDLLTTTYTDTDNVSFTDKGRTYNLFNDGGFVSINELPSADISSGSSLGGGARLTRTSIPAFSPDFSSLGTDIVAKSYDEASISTSAGLTNLQYTGDTTTSMVAYTTSDYATGWQNGDIKLATLSDTDDTDVTGSELVTNGDFATDSDWTKGTGWTIGSGVATHDETAGAGDLTQSIALTSGQKYVLSWEVTSGDGGEIYPAIGGTYPVSFVGNAGSYNYTFTASGTMNIGVRGSSLFTGSIDNVSVRLAEEDRSVNGNGLQVFGSITKNPVATGADLVAYSGFSVSNYLQQPYNSDLDFGTGDFCIMGWYKTSDTTAANEILFARVDSGNAAAINTLITSSETITLQTRESSTSSTTTTTETAPTGVWNCFAFVRRASGTVQEVYINGKLSTSATVTARNMSSSTGKVYLGYTPELASNAKGSMALWRISATAPSPEQIKKIYEDEKFLFQEGAQATLYGSSDAVTALAYDDTTNLLHVGTSAGRSVFQGLRRVDNTTTAVSTAISASNNLVGEQ